jgi:hypothetical protein
MQSMISTTTTSRDVYSGSDPAATRALYARLALCGPSGIVALSLFRARRSLDQAGRCQDQPYAHTMCERRDRALRQLCRALLSDGLDLGISWGWSRDSSDQDECWRLLVDLPQGQVMFRLPRRGTGFDYAGQVDRGPDRSEERILAYCDQVLASAKDINLFTGGR